MALGNPYTVQLGHIYVDLLNVYKAFSELINTAIATSGATNVHLMHTSGVRAMRAVKKEEVKRVPEEDDDYNSELSDLDDGGAEEEGGESEVNDVDEAEASVGCF